MHEDGHGRQVESEDNKNPTLQEMQIVESDESHCLQFTPDWHG
jgi:hypothetical protein